MLTRILLIATILAAGVIAPAANASVPLDLNQTVTANIPPAIHPVDDGCLLDDPSSCAPDEEPPVPGGPKGGPPSSGQQSFCDEYKKSLGDMADTVFGKKQLERLGC